MSEPQVYIKFYLAVQKYIKLPNGNEYVFIPRANISMTTIPESDVQTVLDKKRSCCNKSSRPMFRRANDDDIRRWTNGGGR